MREAKTQRPANLKCRGHGIFIVPLHTNNTNSIKPNQEISLPNIYIHSFIRCKSGLWGRRKKEIVIGLNWCYYIIQRGRK